MEHGHEPFQQHVRKTTDAGYFVFCTDLIGRIFKHPYEKITDDWLKRYSRKRAIKKESLNAPIIEVNVTDIYPTQEILNFRKIIEFLLMNIEAEPIAVRKDGKVILWDGHHRAIAEILRGKTKIKMRLIEADNEIELYDNKNNLM